MTPKQILFELQRFQEFQKKKKKKLEVPIFYFLLDYCFNVFSVEYAMCLKESTYFVF